MQSFEGITNGMFFSLAVYIFPEMIWASNLVTQLDRLDMLKKLMCHNLLLKCENMNEF